MCRTKSCIKVSMQISKPPVNDKGVILQVTVIGGCTHYGKGNSLEFQSVLPNCRFLSANKRHAAAYHFLKTGTKAQVYCNEQLAQMTEAEIYAGHRTKCQTSEVLRQAIHEPKNKSNLHENIVVELCLMMNAWHAALGNTICGFIQGLGYMPFYVYNFFIFKNRFNCISMIVGPMKDMFSIATVQVLL